MRPAFRTGVAENAKDIETLARYSFEQGLAARRLPADEIFHPDFVNHYEPEGRPIPATPGPAGSFQTFYGMLLRAFPDASMAINEQLAERDLVATRKTLRGTHRGELWGLTPTGNRVAWEYIDTFRVRDGKLVEHWTHMDFEDLRQQMRPRE